MPQKRTAEGDCSTFFGLSGELILRIKLKTPNSTLEIEG
jgi:hypothetical protein